MMNRLKNLFSAPSTCDDHGRGEHRCGNVDELVADEDGHDQAPRLAQQALDQAQAGIALRLHLLQLDAG